MAKRVVLAYSGGLDTSVAVRWMIDELGVEVDRPAPSTSARRATTGTSSAQRALAAGAVEADRRRRPRGVRRATSSCPRSRPTPCTRAATRSSRRCPGRSSSSTSSRPPARHGADAVAHGCTGKGNDQVRFEVSTRALAPDLEVLAPVRVVGHDPRGLRSSTPTTTTSRSRRRRRRCTRSTTTSGAGPSSAARWRTRGPCRRPGVWPLTKPTATEPRDVVDRLRAGRARRGRRRAAGPARAHRPRSTTVVGSYGWGRIDMVENRRVGIKSRETYECPAGLALILAHADLESICLERDLAREKARLEPRYAELIYDGLWFSPAEAGARRLRRREPALRHRRGAPAPRARARARSPAAAARTASTTTAWPPTTPPTRFRHEDCGRLRPPVGPRHRDLGGQVQGTEPS